jgi:hypothetical protein
MGAFNPICRMTVGKISLKKESIKPVEDAEFYKNNHC